MNQDADDLARHPLSREGALRFSFRASWPPTRRPRRGRAIVVFLKACQAYLAVASLSLGLGSARLRPSFLGAHLAPVAIAPLWDGARRPYVPPCEEAHVHRACNLVVNAWGKVMKLLTCFTAGVFLSLGGPASACTMCQIPVAQSVREQVFGAEFWPNLGVTILPFAIFLAIAATIHSGFPARNRHRKVASVKGQVV